MSDASSAIGLHPKLLDPCVLLDSGQQSERSEIEHLLYTGVPDIRQGNGQQFSLWIDPIRQQYVILLTNRYARFAEARALRLEMASRLLRCLAPD